MNKIYSTLLFFVASLQLLGQTNEGHEFWFGFMEHIDENSNTKVAMITSKSTTSGFIRIPGRGFSLPFSVNANDVTIIPLPNYTENFGSETKANVGVQVISEQPVSVYIHQYSGMRSEAAVVLPIESIGRNYYVITYEGFQGGGTVYPSEFLIVGVRDETVITIELSDQTVRGKPAGSSFQVTLDAGETYQVQASTAQGDLTGTRVSGDKNFALFGGNKWTEVPNGCAARDNLLEQMYPVGTWGKQFVTVPNERVNFDIFRIVSAEDNNTITVESSADTKTYNLNSGQFVEYQIGRPTYIIGTKPIQVVQYNVGSRCSGHNVGDPSMVLLNSIEQTRDTVTLFNSSFENITENYINIVTRTQDTGIIVFDGQRLVEQGIEFRTVGAEALYAYATVQVSVGAHTIASDGCGIIATAYGYGNVESYAYGGGASFSTINSNPIPDGGCLNDTVFFNTGLSPNRYGFYWDLGDGSFSTQSRFEHYYNDLGSYPITLIINDMCLNTVDTFYKDLMITLRQAVDAVPDILICQGDSVRLGATDLESASFVWEGPLNYKSEEHFPLILDAQPQISGEYQVIGIVSGCATFPSYTYLEVKPTPQPGLMEDTIFCPRTDAIDLTTQRDFISYTWQNGSVDPGYLATVEGIYWVDVMDEFGCQGRDSVELTRVCPTQYFMPNVFTPNGDGINDSFGPKTVDIESMSLQIFDRWGNLLFESLGVNNPWDGMVNGNQAEQGVYSWQMTYLAFRSNGEQYQATDFGTITLIR